MRVEVVEHWDSITKRIEWLFKELNTPNDFELLLGMLLVRHGLAPTESIDGIWFLKATFDTPSQPAFVVVWQEDVGVYAYTLPPSAAHNDAMGRLLREAVQSL